MRKFLCSAAALAAFALASAAQAPAQAHEYKVGDLVIEHPWARATARTAPTGAGYLEIRNTGAKADRLIGATSEAAELTQIHEVKMDGGVMHMRELTEGLEIPPGGAVTLAPGGNHVMFIHLKAPFVAGAQVNAILKFERAGDVPVALNVQAPRDKPEGHMTDKKH